MKDEQYLEITSKINNLKTLIQKKHSYPEILHQSYKKILSDIPDKTFYLSKHSRTLDKIRSLPETNSFEKQRVAILEESRARVRKFSNDLEQLDDFMRKKNKLRAIRVREEQSTKARRLAEKIKQPVLQSEIESQSYCRAINQSSKKISQNQSTHNSSPFQGVKVEKFLELYKQYTKKHKSDPKTKFKFPGVGFEFTPLYTFIKSKKKQKENDLVSRQGYKSKRMKQTIDTVYLRNKAMFSPSKQSKNLFESRMRQMKELQSQIQESIR